MSRKRKKNHTTLKAIGIVCILLIIAAEVYTLALLGVIRVEFIKPIDRHPKEIVIVDATPTAEPTPEPTPAPTRNLTPVPTVSPTPSPTPLLKYAGTTVTGASIMEKSKIYKDNHITNILSRIPADGLKVPTFFQGEYKTVVCYAGGRKTTSSSGCGPTTVSMIVAWVTGNYDQTPYTQMYLATEVGDYFGQGLTLDAVRHMLRINNIVAEIKELSTENVLESLRQGRPCIMHMGPGTFTNNGHYIILRGIAPDGKVYVNDPASPERSTKTYEVRHVVGQCKEMRYVEVGALSEQTGVKLLPEEKENVVYNLAVKEASAIGFGTVIEPCELCDTPGGTELRAVDRNTVLEIVEKAAAPDDSKVWYGVLYNGEKYYIRSNHISPQWYEAKDQNAAEDMPIEPEETGIEPDSLDDPDSSAIEPDSLDDPDNPGGDHV